MLQYVYHRDDDSNEINLSHPKSGAIQVIYSSTVSIYRV